jgi:hypothetical protein
MVKKIEAVAEGCVGLQYLMKLLQVIVSSAAIQSILNRAGQCDERDIPFLSVSLQTFWTTVPGEASGGAAAK